MNLFEKLFRWRVRNWNYHWGKRGDLWIFRAKHKTNPEYRVYVDAKSLRSMRSDAVAAIVQRELEMKRAFKTAV